MNRKLYGVLILVSLLCTVAGILTLIPAAGASYPNVLGYRSLCTFAPAASLFCFLAAGITCTLRASLIKRAAYSNGKPVFKVAPMVVLIVVAGLAVASTFWIASVKADYSDGSSSATVALADQDR